jgi:hypothetical protein
LVLYIKIVIVIKIITNRLSNPSKSLMANRHLAHIFGPRSPHSLLLFLANSGSIGKDIDHMFRCLMLRYEVSL